MTGSAPSRASWRGPATAKGVEFCGRRDRPLDVSTGRRRERGEFQCAGVSVEGGPQDGVAGFVEDECTPKHQVVDAVVVIRRWLRLLPKPFRCTPPRVQESSLDLVIGEEGRAAVLNSTSQVG